MGGLLRRVLATRQRIGQRLTGEPIAEAGLVLKLGGGDSVHRTLAGDYRCTAIILVSFVTNSKGEKFSLLLEHRVTAVDQQIATGHERGIAARQERRAGSDFVGFAEPVEQSVRSRLGLG